VNQPLMKEIVFYDYTAKSLKVKAVDLSVTFINMTEDI